MPHAGSIASSLFQHRHCNPRDADQFILFVYDADIPDLAAFPEVERPRRADDESLRDGAYVIGIDLLADGPILRRVDDEARRDAAERFRERDGRAAMKNAEGLAGAVVDRQAAPEIIGAELDELDPARARERRGAKPAFLERVRAQPDHPFLFRLSPTRLYASRNGIPSLTTSSFACAAA